MAPKKTVVAPIVPTPPSIEETKKEKAPRKPRATKQVDEPSVAPPPVNAIDDAEEFVDADDKTTEAIVEPVVEVKPKAPRKPRATNPKVISEVKPDEKADEKPEEVPAPKIEEVPSDDKKMEEPKAPAPKQRGRPKKAVEPTNDVMKPIPTHEMTPRAKANPKVKVVNDEDNNPAKRKKREPKVDAEGNIIKRAPTEYNIFMSKTLLALKDEYKDYEVKPNQKELMAEAAGKWRDHKASMLPPI